MAQHTKLMAAAGLLAVLCCFIISTAQAATATSEYVCPNQGTDDLTSFVQDVRQANSYVAQPVGVLAAVARFDPYVAKNFKTIPPTYVKGFGSEGLRHWAHGWPMRDNDTARIGSNTKAFTATLIAMLVEKKAQYAPGKVFTFDTKIGDLLAGYTMNDAWKGATIRNVLNMQAGIGSDIDPEVSGSSETERRASFARGLLATAPGILPGLFTYSNANYLFLGFVVDVVSGQSWEKLVKEWIFDKVGLPSAAVGPVGVNGQNQGPYGHEQRMGAPLEYDALYGQTNLYKAPAGDIHLSPKDHAAWAAWHLAGLGGAAPAACPAPWQPPCLSAATFQALHTPGVAVFGTNNYAMGWGRTSNSWAGSGASQHTGGLNGWVSDVWVMPARGLAVSVTTNHVRRNQTSGKTVSPMDYVRDIVQALVEEYKLPSCPAAQPAPTWRYQQQTQCTHTTTVLSAQRCRALAGPPSNGLSYRPPNNGAVTSYSQCAKSCIADRDCRAWSFKPLTLGNPATDNTLGCYLVKRLGLTLGAGRRLSQAGWGNDKPYACEANAQYTSGEVVRVTSSVKANTSFGSLIPSNGVANAQCTDNVFACANLCYVQRQAPSKCNGFTWNASTKKCFLFSQHSAILEDQPRQAHCVLFTGVINDNC